MALLLDMFKKKANLIGDKGESCRGDVHGEGETDSSERNGTQSDQK